MIKDSYASIKEAEKAVETYCIYTNSQFLITKAEAGFMSKVLCNVTRVSKCICFSQKSAYVILKFRENTQNLNS